MADHGLEKPLEGAVMIVFLFFVVIIAAQLAASFLGVNVDEEEE